MYLCSPFPNRYATLRSPFITTVEYSGNIVFLEHVVINMTVGTVGGSRGDTKITLTSPSGTESILLDYRIYDIDSGEYSLWAFMSVMFWGENPAGEWTLTVLSDYTAYTVVYATLTRFEFYGTSKIPQAVASIPTQCHSDCARGCAAEGSAFCDACVKLRNAYTLECIESCPTGFTERNGYCYNSEEPEKTCNTPLKEKG